MRNWRTRSTVCRSGSTGRITALLPAELEGGVRFAVRLPGNGDTAGVVGEGTVFGGVGGKLVQDHGDRERRARIEAERPANDVDPVVAAGTVRLEYAGD